MSVETAHLLCDHVRLLERQHRAGITPSYGQVEDLFDLARRLDTSLDAGAPLVGAPTARCARPGCGEVATVPIGPFAYCAPCAVQFRMLLQQLQAFGLDARTTWPTAPGHGGDPS